MRLLKKQPILLPGTNIHNNNTKQIYFISNYNPTTHTYTLKAQSYFTTPQIKHIKQISK